MENNNDVYLYHYGVKGMRWGVRRYEQNRLTGRATKKRIKSFDDLSAKYDKEKAEGKSWWARRGTRTQMKNAYRKVKQSHRADQGKEYYSQGKTIGDSRRRVAAATWGAAAVGNCLLRYGARRTGGKVGSALAISSAAVGLGGSLVGNVLEGKRRYEDNRLRAYYVRGN